MTEISSLIPHPSSLFISGTDTGVGKTVVTALLALRYQMAGVNVGVMKPFASGCESVNGTLECEDATWLRAVTEIDDELNLINPIRVAEPLAPVVAAQRAGVDTSDWLPRVQEAYAELQRRHDCVLVEGVGGLLAPILRQNEEYFTCADFAGVLGLPVLVVARRVLGTINHTVLTCRYPLPLSSRVAGVLFCDAVPVEEDDVAAQTSPAVIEAMTGIKCWGQIPYQPELSRAALLETAKNYLPQMEQSTQRCPPEP